MGEASNDLPKQGAFGGFKMAEAPKEEPQKPNGFGGFKINTESHQPEGGAFGNFKIAS